VVCPPGVLNVTAWNVEPVGHDSAPGDPAGPGGPGGPSLPVPTLTVTVFVGACVPCPIAFATRKPPLAASASAAPSRISGFLTDYPESFPERFESFVAVFVGAFPFLLDEVDRRSEAAAA